MRRYGWLACAMTVFAIGCQSSVNVDQERSALLKVDGEWGQTTKDLDKFVSYYAPDATVYAPGMPMTTGAGPIREATTKMMSAPGFSLMWTAAKADVSASGDVGYTTGTYQMMMNGATEKGKFVTVWKKQADGTWKVKEDIISADGAESVPSQHVAVIGSELTWGDPPPVLPPGAKFAVVSGDPGKAGPFAIRLQLPAGYKIAPHWHPTDENVTVLSGTFVLGMGEAFDQAAMKDLPAGSYGLLPAQMRHYAMAKTATTVQVHGTGPFAITYVNAADDPSQQQK